MRMTWTSLYGVLAVIWAVQGTYTYHSFRCDCNGRSQYCLPDARGLHCVDCQDNTEGRHCERCKDGFYHQRAGLSCTPCHCSTEGSVSLKCDSRGRCSCKEGVSGDQCDLCPSGAPVGPDGCSDRPLSDEPQRQSECFCSGHSRSCSAAPGYSVHSISSTFSDGPEGWRAATAHGVTPSQVHFRWSPKHQDIEVISKNSLPVYLYAPARYLGNQALSYSQNLSFSLRLDRGVRHPSTSDVVLEGSGLRVAASLGNLRSIVPCAQKISYSFRLDEQPSSRWRPHLSPVQFQMLLQNLTAIKIRGTFGENGRGYLDDVQLDSARLGAGIPATWVQSCNCPDGYEGQFCERCTSGYKRKSPSNGAFSPCEPCHCQGGNCDPDTGDCFSADETTGHQSCPPGSYSDPDQLSCVKCPCPSGVSCSLAPTSLEIRCDLCPPGTTGSRCHVCQEGFYGNPLGEAGLRRPCRPCQCNGHVDPSVAGNCDPSTGECLKCLNNTRGKECEACVDGYYHRQPSHVCKPCDCDVQGSVSDRCSEQGQCQCRTGFEGLRCQRSPCPSCFTPIKRKIERYTAKLQELETLFTDMEGGSLPVSDSQMESLLRGAELLVEDLQENAGRLTESEKSLQGRLSLVSQSQLTEGRDIQIISNMVDSIKQQHQTYQREASDIQTLIQEMQRKLLGAKHNIQSAELPLGDAAQGTDILATLLQRATDLAEKHQTKADTIERSANEALSDSEKSLALVRTLMNKENKVKELVGDLKTMYDETSAHVKALESQATRLSSEAGDESSMAEGMLKQITSMEENISAPLKEEMDAMVDRLKDLKEHVGGNITGYQELQEALQGDKAAAEDLLAQGKAAQQEHDKLLAKVNAAKADTEAALRGITDNMDGLDDALAKLRGFDKQIDDNRALAEEAIKRLPAINATIQQAVESNAQTLSVLGNVAGDYSDALGTISQLETVVSGLEGTSGSLPSHTDLVTNATDLKKELQSLGSQAEAAEKTLARETESAQRQKTEAERASLGADGAYDNAKQTRDAVGVTLQTVKNLLDAIGQPGSIDEQRLIQLENSLADARSHVNQQLKPRLQNMEEKEAAQRTRLTGLNLDIDNILRDITNLEDILRTAPKGCFNSPPIERP
ncbi:laminin subunit gamma-2 [Polymixia lowei]